MHLTQVKNSIRSWITRLFFERRFGVQTAGRIDLDALGLAGEDRWRYEPAEWRVLSRVLGPRDIGPNDVFLDFGSGMGRVVLRAAQLGPKRVIGVELSEDLNKIARRNVAQMRHRLQCQDIELHTADALDFDVPDDVSIVFFNNPFTGQIFAKVMQKLVTSLERKPRHMRIVYRNPIEHESVIETGRFELVKQYRRTGLRRKPSGLMVYLYDSVD